MLATLLLAAALEAERLVPGLAHICLFPTYVLLALQVYSRMLTHADVC
jgi:hypothetical protein